MQSPSKLNRRRYRAPEYASGGKLVERPNSITSDACMGTRALEMGDFDSLTVARLEKNYNEREMFQMIETIAECIRRSAPMKLQMGLVSGFGLAKLAMDAVTHVTTRVMGTFGYMAPEYASSVKLTERSDVYSSNVVLLELITGRKPVGTSQPLGDESLVEWVGATLVFPLLKFFFVCTLPQKPMSPPMELVMRALDGLACFNR